MKKGRIIRILLVVLSILCGSEIVYAIERDNIITICYVTTDRNDNKTYNYLAATANSNMNTVENKTAPDVYCLWKVGTSGTQYSFQNLGDPTKYLKMTATWENKNKLSIKLQTATTGSSFTLKDSKLSYMATDNDNTAECYLRYSGTWQGSTRSNDNTSLTIEEWERKDVAGGLKGEFLSSYETFGLAQTDTRESKTIQFKITREVAQSYYYCLNRPDVKIDITPSGNVDSSSEIDLQLLNFGWLSNSGRTTSRTTCSNFEDDVVKDRDLLSVSFTEHDELVNTWNVTVTAVGSSPMNLKDINDNWIDYSDELVASFRDADDPIQTTHKASTIVKREAYHRKEWPIFPVNASPTSYTFGKYMDEATIEFSCWHQHGADIIKSDDQTKAGEDVLVGEENVTNTTNITFTAKSMVDETTVDWLKVKSINNGKLIISATDNSLNGTKRYARLVGVFTYTNPNDATDTHTKTIEIPITQNFKDGTMTFTPQKGYANTEFGKNPYTNEDEQQVHIAEKTIYYLPGENITLRIAETSFNTYYRWYDYQTGGNPQYNAIASDRTTWATQPAGTLINNSEGDTYGIYITGEEGKTIPVIKGWADGKEHIIACDISNYTDYSVTNDGNTIKEPTLSFRQLFHLRPAQEMAEKFKAAAAKDEFVENHSYTAPINQNIYLTTDYRYAAGDDSDKSYYYYKNGVDASGGYGCVGKDGVSAKWFEVNNGTYSDITPDSYIAKDFLPRKESQVGTKVYELGVDVNNNKKIDDGDIRIARFEVEFVSDCGPSINPLITRDQILNSYVLLEEIDFSFGAPAPGNTIKFLNRHLDWEDASYGYVYPDVSGSPRRTRASGGSNYNPYWGEYYITNKIPDGCSWAHKTENYGGMANGYALYVDGTSEPGLVASISTDATICSGQTMYCSMWLSNLVNDTKNTVVNPVFRCNIQGRHTDNEEWTDVGVFFVGEMAKQDGKWYQIDFPVVSAQESYDQTRVCIYNFATSAGGNDFMVDDIRLYVSPLPLAAYHATTGCKSYSDEETTNTVVVVRIDYGQLNDDQRDKYVYYHIFDTTDSATVALKEKNGDTYQSIYYNDDQSLISIDGVSTDTVGSIKIPMSRDGSGVETAQSINAYINSLIPEVGGTSRSGKCFIQDNGKWFLYLVHVIPSRNSSSGEEHSTYLDREKSYILRIAHDYRELYKAACVFTTELHATQDTYIQLRNEEVDSLRLTGCLDNLCANNHHFLDVKVQNTITPTAGATPQTIEALVHADWLIGFGFDDIYCNKESDIAGDTAVANEAFLAKYGYHRSDVEQAIAAMRNTSPNNVNRTKTDAKSLVTIDGMFTQKDLDIITDLYDRELLTLYHKTKMFYLGSKDTVRYWVYPVTEDATVSVNGADYTLVDCNEPKWAMVSSSFSEYGVNLSPIDKDNQTQQQRLELPAIRLIEGTTRVSIPITKLLEGTKLNTELSPNKDAISFLYNELPEKVLEYVDLSNNTIKIVGAPTTLEPGKEYLMRMAFFDKDGYAYIDGSEDNCRVGYVYFYLTIVPQIVQWTGESSVYWGDDKNWKGVNEDGSLMEYGFAPLPLTKVIIKALDELKPYPMVTTEDYYPMDVNYLPNSCDMIYFESGAMIHNQHLLQYNRAFVDMQVPATAWNTLSPPMKGMYTGDMYIPHKDNDFSATSNSESQNPFVVNGFQGKRHNSAPYAFWQSFYNKRVTTYHENYNTSSAVSTNTASFAQTNSLQQELLPGTGFQVLAYGPTNAANEKLIVRLPKPDTEYSYYNSDGSESDLKASVSHSSKLAFEPNANGDMRITLTNAEASRDFMFGNPTMTNINMVKFLETNGTLLENTYYTMENGTWNAESIAFAQIAQVGVLAPMRSVLLKLKESVGAKTSIILTLSASHLEGYDNPTSTVATRKHVASEELTETQLMTIYATSETGRARCMLATKADAYDTYESGEDALFISSGVEAEVNSATATSPINMYTVSKQVPMMVDVREKIDTVPLSMLVHDSYRTEKVKFAFYLSLNWDKECYLNDALTGERYRIMDGLWLELDMPANHEPRYFITGPDDASDSGIITSTTHPDAEIESSDIKLWAYSPDNGALVVSSNDIIKELTVYDLTGRVMAHHVLELQHSTSRINVPTGLCIVEAVMRDNTKQHTQAIVR